MPPAPDARAAPDRAPADAIEVSVVIPCLDEADTLGACLSKIWQTLRAAGLAGEVIVADNGSTDESVAIAERAGAKVVHVASRGYGSALMGGIAAARGRYIVMGDADDSYDFAEVPRFVHKLREGYDLVQGCRLPSGGGRVLPGAMPFLHRWLGNPLFSLLARWWFRAPIHDVYCGLRGFSAAFYARLDQRCTGMEFATEMIVKSSLVGGRLAEIPITLHPDGRRGRAPHLRWMRDGWRTLRFFLTCSPRWLFLVPGALLVAGGAVTAVLALPALDLGGGYFDTRALVLASVAMICGYQAIVFAVVTKTFAIVEGLLPDDPRLTRLFERINLERGLVVGAAGLVLGVSLLVWAGLLGPAARAEGDGADARVRWTILGATLTAMGFQTVLTSFLISFLGMRRR